MTPRPLAHLLEAHLVPWTTLPWPVDWGTRLGRPGPVAVEIGFGNGDFLVRLARARPEVGHVGIEIAWGSVQRLVRRLGDEAIDNVLVLQGDAAYLVERVFAPGSIGAAYVNFSDPWRKARHHDRRLVRATFLETLGDRLAPGAEVVIATDHAEYADWIEAELATQRVLEPARGAARLGALPGRVPTRYEEKARAAGRPVHYFVWRRRPAPYPALAGEDFEPMPNVILDRLTVDPALPFAEPRRFRTGRPEDAIVIRTLAAWRRAGRDETLVEVLVKEGPFLQHFAILIAPRAEGGMLVKPAPVGEPRPTRGVKLAVRRAAEAILAADPGARVVRSTVGDIDPRSAAAAPPEDEDGGDETA